MDDELQARLSQLETTVRRAADALGRLREENERLKRELARLASERQHVVSQIDAILNDLAKLDL
jgi:FtsZ-binding cell division protein ZapB